MSREEEPTARFHVSCGRLVTRGGKLSLAKNGKTRETERFKRIDHRQARVLFSGGDAFVRTQHLAHGNVIENAWPSAGVRYNRSVSNCILLVHHSCLFF